MSIGERLENLQDKLVKNEKYGGGVEESDNSLDGLIEELENDDDDEFLSKYRDQRIEKLSEYIKEVKSNINSGMYGGVITFSEEDKLMKETAESDRIVLHFYLDSFSKCRVMDSKLQILAEKHLHTKFVRISVEDAPFLVHKLDIKVLPLLISYKSGTEVGRLVGFTKLGNGESDFPILKLEQWLNSIGVISHQANRLGLASKSTNLQGDTDASESDEY